MTNLRELLRALPEPDDRASDRVRRRVRASLAERRSPRLGFWIPIGALAAAAALLIGLWPTPPVPLDVAIESVDSTTSIALATYVNLVAHGRGHAAGTDDAPALRWDEGDLAVEVEPGKGVDLVVTTDEATVRVVGTGFTVKRSALGTSVGVLHGKVSVDCVAGGSSLLTAEQAVECPPTRPAGLLGRARALAARGESADVVLQTLDTADRPDNPPALAGEILAFRVDVLRNAGRDDAALAAAQRYLEAGHKPRRAAVRRIASALLLERGGCASALPLLRAAVDEGGDSQDAAALAACDARGGR